VTPRGDAFTVRAFRLDDERGRRREQVALLIRREEARSLCRSSAVRGTRSSHRSSVKVALLLAQGKTNPEIAEVLGLTLNTASYHVKQVYLRLRGQQPRGGAGGACLKRAHLDVAAGP
jgi:DNA-binding NarL/FixJ family response regulator